jgi:hypothetical protein
MLSVGGEAVGERPRLVAEAERRIFRNQAVEGESKAEDEGEAEAEAEGESSWENFLVSTSWLRLRGWACRPLKARMRSSFRDFTGVDRGLQWEADLEAVM